MLPKKRLTPLLVHLSSCLLIICGTDTLCITVSYKNPNSSLWEWCCWGTWSCTADTILWLTAWCSPLAESPSKGWQLLSPSCHQSGTHWSGWQERWETSQQPLTPAWPRNEILVLTWKCTASTPSFPAPSQNQGLGKDSQSTCRQVLTALWMTHKEYCKLKVNATCFIWGWNKLQL